MTKTAALRGLFAGLALLACSVTHAYAQNPSPAQMLDPKLGPKFDDVNMSVPTADELPLCKVELVQGGAQGASGWLLKDSKGQPLRRFFDSSGDKKVDTWSYYKDGIEVYREFDTAGKGLPNNFRWLNSNGMKWALGAVNNGRGYVTSWRMISAEEVGFEAFQAIARQDFGRLQVLFITDAEMQAIKLPNAKINAVRANLQPAQQKFALVCKKLGAGVKFDMVEGAVPQCDTTGDVEIIHHPDRQVRLDRQGKYEFLNTQEMIQVGMAWRLADVPVFGPIEVRPDGELQKLLQILADLDVRRPPEQPLLAKNGPIDQYYRKRIPYVQAIIKLVEDKERDGWYKQLFDNMMALAQNSGEKVAIDMLAQLKDDVVRAMPGSNLAAYATYRYLWTGYSIRMVFPPPKPDDVKKFQDQWLADLASFVKSYPKADDTPEALHQLAIGCEFDGKNEEGKRWYRQLYENFPDHNLAPRARGSEARLNLVGSAFLLAAPLLADGAKRFDIAQLRNKVVVVHYWGSYTEQYKDDFVRLKRVIDQVGTAKGVELVCINLDESANRASEAVIKGQLPGIHLFQATNNAAGLNSPLATQYGIHMLPTIFVIGRDGRVTNNNVQVGDIEAALKNAQ